MIRRRLHLPGAITTAALLLASCAGDDTPTILDGASPDARRIETVWWQLFALGTAVYVVVAGLVLWGIARRRRAGNDDTAARRGDVRFIVVGGIVVPAFVLFLVGIITVDATADIRGRDDGALQVEVAGHRWWWEVRYPDQDIVTANVVHVPVGRPVEITLLSEEVIHAFWVPRLGGKVDMFPGRTTTAQLTADEPGVYRGQCAEYCGLQHANMAFQVVALDAAEFDEWIKARQRAVAELTTDDEPLPAGLGVFLGAACGACHTIAGTAADGTRGPDLTHVGSRPTLAAGTVPNTPGHLAQWIVDPDLIKPGARMPAYGERLTPEQIGVLVDFLESLE